MKQAKAVLGLPTYSDAGGEPRWQHIPYRDLV